MRYFSDADSRGILAPMRHISPTLLATVLVLIAGAFYGGYVLGARQVPVADRVMGLINKEGDPLTALALNASSTDFGLYWKVWNTLESKFVPFGTTSAERIPAEKRVERSVEGLVASYKDPYTVFFPAQEAEEFKIMTRGSLEGIGAVIGDREGALLVVTPLVGSPAEKAGLVSGDEITHIDGSKTKGLTVDAAVDRIRGKGGTTVTLTVVRRASSTEPFDLPIVRGSIEIPSIKTEVVAREVALRPREAEAPPSPPASIAGEGEVPAPVASPPPEPEKVTRDFFVLQLFSFSETSIKAFERGLREFRESGTGLLIVDLRGNPGGYLEAAVDIASWFLPEGTVVVREFQGPNLHEVVHRTKQHELFGEDKPRMVILVNRASASASEILAAALQEAGVATLIGEHTFGKGSVQELVNLTDDVSLKVTVARWYTPSGRSISEGGLTPDIVVDPTPTASSTDPIMDAAVDFLVNGTSTSSRIEL